MRIFFTLAVFVLTAGISIAAPGDFDPTFGGVGAVTYNTDTYTNDWDYGYGVAIQQDGKIVVTGSIPSPDGLGYDAVVLRYNSGGTLDGTFGGDGIVTYDNYYHTDDGGESIAIQPDGKIVIVGWTYVSGHKDVLVLRYNEDGSLDISFGEDGVAIYSGSGGGDDVGYAVAIQQDGKIVVVGYGFNNASNDDVLILRYNSNGTLDTTFGDDGIVTYNGIMNDSDAGYGIAIQQDGKIVVVGYSYNGYIDQHYEDILVLRYESNGTLDTTFNGTGVALYDSSTGGYNYDYGYGVAIQQDGKIVVTGYSYDGLNRSAVILRYSSDGTLDVTFSEDGVAIYDIPANRAFAGFRVAMQTDGKIVVAGGGGWNGNNSDIVFLRYNSDGILDGSFGGNGVLLYNGVENGDEWGNAVAIQPDGKIVVVGHGWNGSNNVDILVLRCNSDGTFDITFGSSGTVTYSSSSYWDHYDYGYAVAIQPDGKIIIVGNNIDILNYNFSNVLILRYNSDGSLDNTFGINGIVTTRGFMRNDFGYGVVMQPDGKIVVAGTSWRNGWDVLVMRFNSDGTPDMSFGSYGAVVYDSGSDDGSYGIALQQDGKIVVVGYKFSLGLPVHDALIVRYNSDGTLDKTFGENGITTYNSRSNGADFGEAVALQPDGKIVVTGSSNTAPSIYEAFVLRYNSNGSLDSTFGVDGVVIYDNFYQDFGYGVAIQPNAKIVVVGEEYGDSLVLRYNSDGTLDPSFGKDGSVTFDSGGYDYSSAVAIQPQGKIVVTGSSSGNTLIARYNNDGLLDSTFGGDGVIFYEGGVNGSGITVQPDDKIVVTGSSWNYGNNTYDVLTLRLFGNAEYPSVFLTPDAAVIPRGGTLVVQVTITNNTEKAGTVLFATNVTLPNGNPYPPSGYLFGPKEITFDPHQSKSGQISHTIPGGAPLGIYTYHGYVGRPGVGIMDADHFNFEVVTTPALPGAKGWETTIDQNFSE